MGSPHHIKGPLPRLIVTDRDTAGRILRHPGLRREVKWVVSIGSMARPCEGWSTVSPKHRLRLEFDDIERPYYDGYKMPSPYHVRDIVSFAKAARSGSVLAHCAMGQSRSAAAALTMAAVWWGPGKEQEAVQQLHTDVADAAGKLLRPVATAIHPNRLLAWIADRELGRSGRLWEALCRSMGPEYTRGFDPKMSGY